MVQIQNEQHPRGLSHQGAWGASLRIAVEGPDMTRKQESPTPHCRRQSQREAKSGICSQLRMHFWTKISQKWGLSVVLITVSPETQAGMLAVPPIYSPSLPSLDMPSPSQALSPMPVTSQT